mgnify:CR=1 FL=1
MNTVYFHLIMKRSLILSFISLVCISAAPQITVISSNESALVFRVDFSPQTEDDLKPFSVLMGIPTDSYPNLEVVNDGLEEFQKIPENQFKQGVRWIQKQNLRGLHTASLEISPVYNPTQYYKSMLISIQFEDANIRTTTANPTQKNFLSNRILNWNVAQSWFLPQNISRKRIAPEFSSGTWIRFSVQSDDAYYITGNTLLGLSGIPLDFDLRSLKMYSSAQYGRSLTNAYTQGTQSERPIPDNLTEIAITFRDNNDDLLDSGDTLIFYGRGASGFDVNVSSIDYHTNLYFTGNTVWLFIPDDSTERGKRMEAQTTVPSPLVSMTYGLMFKHVEVDLINPFESGLAWVGPSISNGSSYSTVFSLGTPNASVAPTTTIGLYGGEASSTSNSNTSHLIRLYQSTTSGSSLGSLSWSGVGSKTGSFPINNLNSGTNTFFLKNEASSSNSKPYMDYFTLSYGEELSASETYEFFAPIDGNKITFEFDGIPDQVWNITDPAAPIPLLIGSNNSKGTISLDLPSDTTQRFLVVNLDDITEIIEFDLELENPFETLRIQHSGTDHLIIGPRLFSEEAADLVNHRTSSIYVNLEDIYAEFSGGNADPVAIRFFIQWTQENWTTKPSHVLLLGDADFDYRNISGESKNQVPTIEVGYNSSARATDDRLATIKGVLPEVSLGRFPAQSESEVSDYIEKVIEYETNPISGLWRQKVTLVADDGARPENDLPEISTGKSHTNNSESLDNIVPQSIEVQKLYMLEYPEVSDASTYGVSKPDATEALLNVLQDGTAIINYIGHGSSSQWAQEALIIQSRDLQSINTGMKLPLWIAGTCSWGHFDQLDSESFSEELIRQDMNGAAAIITTSRAISVYSNQTYLVAIFNALFPNGNVTDNSIGSILQSVKTGGSSGELFHLFGDPALKISIPSDTASVTSVSPDTLKTLETGTFSGSWLGQTGKKSSGFASLLDAERSVTRQYNFLSTTQELSYSLPGATLFRGQFSVNDDQFTGTLRVPKDISYSNNPGLLRVYLTHNDASTGALGLFQNILFAGGSESTDNAGPIISFETEDRRAIRTGDHLVKEDRLFVRISDPIGVNLTGEVGHEIILTNLTSETSKDITAGFVYDLDQIQTGTTELNLSEFSNELSIQIKAWDNANNPTETDLSLSLTNIDQLNLYHVLNFPNPFSTTTQFTFEITASAEVLINIYTLGGRKIKSIEKYFQIGYHSVDWDGRDSFGHRIANGSYLYEIIAVNGERKVSEIKTIVKFQ